MIDKKDFDGSYLTNLLESKTNLNILFMSHNTSWFYLNSMMKQYKNLNAKILGGTIGYEIYNKDFDINKINYDYVILYSNDYFNPFEYEELKELAMKISIIKNKEITIAYSYFISEEDRNKKENSLKIIFSNIYSEKVTEERITSELITDVELIDMAIYFHNKKIKGLLKL